MDITPQAAPTAPTATPFAQPTPSVAAPPATSPVESHSGPFAQPAMAPQGGEPQAQPTPSSDPFDQQLDADLKGLFGEDYAFNEEGVPEGVDPANADKKPTEMVPELEEGEGDPEGELPEGEGEGEGEGPVSTLTEEQEAQIGMATEMNQALDALGMDKGSAMNVLQSYQGLMNGDPQSIDGVLGLLGQMAQSHPQVLMEKMGGYLAQQAMHGNAEFVEKMFAPAGQIMMQRNGMFQGDQELVGLVQNGSVTEDIATQMMKDRFERSQLEQRANSLQQGVTGQMQQQQAQQHQGNVFNSIKTFTTDRMQASPELYSQILPEFQKALETSNFVPSDVNQFKSFMEGQWALLENKHLKNQKTPPAQKTPKGGGGKKPNSQYPDWVEELDFSKIG